VAPELPKLFVNPLFEELAAVIRELQQHSAECRSLDEQTQRDMQKMHARE